MNKERLKKDISGFILLAMGTGYIAFFSEEIWLMIPILIIYLGGMLHGENIINAKKSKKQKEKEGA